MNSPGDLSVTHSSATPDPKNCSIVSIIPIVGMSSCRGRAEAFARRLSSKLRTLGSQDDEAGLLPEGEPIINGSRNTNTWVADDNGGKQIVTDIQPLRHETDSFFDFECELESPGSPVDECEYLRLIESTSNTPHNSASESGYACASAASSQSSADGPYFDVNSENEACSSHLPPRHLSKPGDSTTTDEVDNAASKLQSGKSNGFHAHEDVIKTLPCEGPDIATKKTLTENCQQAFPIQIGMPQILQDHILKELHQQSLEYQDDEQHLGSKRNSKEFVCPAEMPIQSHHVVVMEPAQQQMKQECQQSARTTNGHDVLKTEMPVVIKEEIKTEITNERETKKEIDSNQNEIKTIKSEPDDESCLIENEIPKKSHSNMATTDDEDDCRPQRVRRCSSLKSGKTPPGTPGCKKIVRFADVLGLDLADVKTFLDEIPNIPRSAYEDLEIQEAEPPIQLGPKSDRMLMPLFQQPGGLPNFLDMVREKLVSLENAAVTDSINQTITGSVRVRNLDFHKSVHIRYSLDGWRSFADLQANYVENSCDGFSDKFTFVLFGNSLHIGQRLEFAVRFQCKGQQYWDNNYGANYCFQCLPSAAPVINNITTVLPSHHSNNMSHLLSPTVNDTWCASFY